MKRRLLTWWMPLLLSICSFAATSRDSRLAKAVQSKDEEAIRTLLDQHADVNGPGPDGSTAVMWAAHWDDLKTADRLIRAGANVNVANDEGATPLWLACYNGSSAMVGKLLDAGANPNADHLPAGETALLRCAATGNVNAVKVLLDRRANSNATEKAGQTPLMWAIEEGHPDVARL